MTTAILTPQASADDGWEYGDGSLDTSAGYLDVRCNTNPASAGYQSAFMRLLADVDIPQGSTINSAVPSFYVAVYDDPDLIFYGEDADAPDDLSTNPHVISATYRPRTTASVAWSASNVGLNTWVNGPDLTSIFQEIVNRAGYSGGNHLGLLAIAGTADSTSRILFGDYDAGGVTPYVTIDFTAPAGSPEVDPSPASGSTLDYGAIQLGNTGDAQVTVANIGTASLTLSSPAITGAAAGDYAIVSPSFPVGVPASGSQVITLRATAGALGARAASFTATTDDSDEGTLSYSLTYTGTPASNAPIGLQFLVDWDNDGDFSEAIEDISSYVQGPVTWRLGMGQPWSHLADEAESTWTLVNADKRFSPEYGSSPLAGSIQPQRLMQVRSVYNSGTTVHWTGYLQSVQPVPGIYGRRLATLRGTGSKQFLQGTKVFSDMLEDTTADVVIAAAIDQVDSNFAYATETGKTVLAYVGDNWQDGIDAYAVIKSAVAAERGYFFQDRSGTMQFWNRHHMLKKRSVDGTIDTWHQMNYRYGEDMVNRVGVACRPRKISATANEVLWSLPDETTLKAGASRTWRARFADDSGAEVGGKDVATPSTGAGTLAYSGGSVAVTAFDAQARSAEITLTNSGGTDATITTLQIKGRKVTSWDEQTVFVENSSSITTHGKREWVLGDTELLSDTEQAKTVATYLTGRRGDLAGVIPSLTVMRRNAALEAQMVARTVGDRILVSDEQTGHEREHYILGEQWRIPDAALKFPEVTWVLEPADLHQYFIVGVSRIGSDDRIGY